MSKNRTSILILSICIVITIITATGIGVYYSLPDKKTIINNSVQTNLQLEKDSLFQEWIKKQNIKEVQAYQQLLNSQIKQPPSLFELTFNDHPPSKECVYSQFSLPPRSQWQNIIKPLKIIRRLQAEKIITTYQVISLYRDKTVNTCIRGAKGSKHLKNAAIDIQLAKSSIHTNEDIEKIMCGFWHQNGAALNMGLGIYGNNKYHIDAQGFRSWGKNYKSSSSPCIVAKNS